MSYKLNKTDGELLVELADGQIDTTTTDITLVGKNYKGFGEFFNENFIKMIENFAATAAPGNPLVGQLWYDTSEGRLKLYDGTSFRSAGGPIVSATQPSMVAGDIWIDNNNNKLYFYDGTDLVLVGPDYDAGQGQSGIEVSSVVDISARERVVLKIWVGGTLFGIVAKEEFRLSGDNKIPSFPDDADDVVIPKRQLIKKGFNLVNRAEFWYQGISAETRSLVDIDGTAYTAADFLPTGSNGTTTGSLTIKNSAGLSVGVGDTQYIVLKINGTTPTFETQQSNSNIAFRTRTGNQFKDAIFIEAADDHVGLFTNNPEYTLDVNGDARIVSDVLIEGNLTVQGDTTYFNTSTMTVEDKNIELSVSSGAAAGGDSVADGGGITLKSTDGDKTIVWVNSTDAWTLSEHVNLATGKEFKINNTSVLSSTALGSSITSANGLTSIGTLVELNVDNINLNGNTITTTGAGLTINPSGDISVSTRKITNLGNPTSSQDAATKTYVDTTVASERVVLALDTTGLNTPSTGNPYTDVAAILETLYPASEKTAGTEAKVHCTSYSAVSVTGLDIQGAANKSYIAVDSNGTQNESVVQDINFDPVTGTAAITPNRQTMTFEVVDNAWAWQGTA